MGCGVSRRKGKVSILRHFQIKRENVDSFRTHGESKVLCCSKVLIWAETHLEKLRWATIAGESSMLHSSTGESSSSRYATTDHPFLRPNYIVAFSIDSLSVPLERWRIHTGAGNAAEIKDVAFFLDISSGLACISASHIGTRRNC